MCIGNIRFVEGANDEKLFKWFEHSCMDATNIFEAFDWNHDPGNLICKHPDVCSTYTKSDNEKKNWGYLFEL